MKFIALFLLVLIIFGVSITFGANNDQLVTFNYLVNQREFRLSTLLGLLLGCGFFLGWFLSGIFYIAAKFKLNSIQRKLRKVEKLYESERVHNRKQRLMTEDITLPIKE